MARDGWSVQADMWGARKTAAAALQSVDLADNGWSIKSSTNTGYIASWVFTFIELKNGRQEQQMALNRGNGEGIATNAA
ncbi:hypothetical protein ACP4OV_014577 [Aristida adscensionis]